MVLPTCNDHVIIHFIGAIFINKQNTHLGNLMSMSTKTVGHNKKILYAFMTKTMKKHERPFCVANHRYVDFSLQNLFLVHSI